MLRHINSLDLNFESKSRLNNSALRNQSIHASEDSVSSGNIQNLSRMSDKRTEELKVGNSPTNSALITGHSNVVAASFMNPQVIKISNSDILPMNDNDEESDIKFLENKSSIEDLDGNSK